MTDKPPAFGDKKLELEGRKGGKREEKREERITGVLWEFTCRAMLPAADF